MATEESELVKTFDFLVGTKGRCFLCLIKVEQTNNEKSTSGSESASPPAYSIHRLSRYLGMNMTKVFNEKGPIPTQLLDKAQRSVLKVELCDQCAGLAKTFSVLHQQLENIQEEVTSCLGLIHGKLTTAEETGLSDMFQGSRVKLGNGKEKLEMAQALRNEAMIKCSQKLNNEPSQLEVEQVSTTAEDYQSEQQCEDMQLDIGDVNLIKVEYHDTDLAASNDEDADEIADAEDEGTTYLDYTDDVENQQVSRGKPHSKPKSGGWKKNQSCDLCHVKVRNLSRHLQRVHVTVSPSQSPQGIPKNMHGQQKHTCRICNKQFSQRSSYRFHLRSIHLGEKEKCPTCNKYFTRRSSLLQHHCKPSEADMPPEYKYPQTTFCEHCGRGFSTPASLRRHMKNIHLEIIIRQAPSTRGNSSDSTGK